MTQVYTKMMTKATALALVLGVTALPAAWAQSAPGSSSAIDRSMEGGEGLHGADSMGRTTAEGSTMKDTMDTKTDAGAAGNAAPEPTSDAAAHAEGMSNDATMSSKAAKPAKSKRTKTHAAKTSMKSDNTPLAAWVRPAGSGMDAKPQVVSLSSNSEMPSAAYPPTTYTNGGMVSAGTTGVTGGSTSQPTMDSYSTTTTTVTPLNTNPTATGRLQPRQGAAELTTAPVGSGISTNNQANSTGSRMGSGMTGATANTVTPSAGESDTMGSTTGGSMRGGATQDNDIMKR